MAATSRGTSPVPPDVRPRLTVLSGPSGVGKSTVVAHMRSVHPEVWLSRVGHDAQAAPRESATASTTSSWTTRSSTSSSPTVSCWSGPSSRATATARRAGPCSTGLEAGEPVLLEIDPPGSPAGPPVDGRTRAWSSWPRRAGRSWSAGSPAGAPRRPRSSSDGSPPPRSSWPPRPSSIRRSFNTSVEDVARELLALMLQA